MTTFKNDTYIFSQVLEAIPDERLIAHLEDGGYILYDPEEHEEFLAKVDAVSIEEYEEVVGHILDLVRQGRVDDALTYGDRVLSPKFSSKEDCYLQLAKSSK